MDWCVFCLQYWFFFFTSIITTIAVTIAFIAGTCIYVIGQLDDPKTKLDFSALNVTAVLVVLIGVLIVVTILCGFCGVCLGLRWMLISYSAITVIILSAEVVAICYSWQLDNNDAVSRLTHDLYAGLFASVNLHYNNKVGAASFRLITFLQGKLQCCGCDGPEDYTKISMDYMHFCKKPESNTIYTRGCANATDSWLGDHASLIAGIVFVIVFSQVFVILLACLILCNVSSLSEDED